MRTLGVTSFRECQREAITAVLSGASNRCVWGVQTRQARLCLVSSGKDVLLVLATGSGKSLCFQLPALLLRGVTVVISPLIALMKDQVDALTARKVPACRVWGAMPAEDKRCIVTDLTSRDPSSKLVYVSPESLSTAWFASILQSLFERRRLSLFAVDEAHCISRWVQWLPRLHLDVLSLATVLQLGP